jgi:preprotein translocase subunit SecE
MNASEIEVSNKTPLDFVKVVLAVGMVLMGFVFYYAGKQSDWVAVGVLMLSLVSAVSLFLSSSTGVSLMVFFRASYVELSRVVWPSRVETWQMTLVVFVFVVIMSIFLWAIDKTIELGLIELLSLRGGK